MLWEVCVVTKYLKSNGKKFRLAIPGFTLIELIAVVVILGIILVIAVPRIMDIIENSKLEGYKKNEALLERLATYYLTINNDLFPNEGEVIQITLTDLKNTDLITSLSDVRDKNQDCDGYVEVFKDGVIFNYKGYIICGDNYSTPGYHGFEQPIFTAYGDGGRQRFMGITTTATGYVAVGNSNATNQDMLGLNKGLDDAVIVKYDSEGNIIWDRNFGGSERDYFLEVTSSNNGYVAVGYSLSNDDDVEGLNKGNWDAIIVKYDLNGNLLWNRNFGGTGDDRFEDIVTVSGGYIVVGRSTSSNGDLVGLAKGGWDAIILKYDFNGNLLWNKNFGGTSTDYFFGVDVSDNAIIAAGYSWSNNGDLVGMNKGNADGIIVKYDLNGNVIWNKNFGGSGNDYFEDIVALNDGYVAVGRSASNNGDLMGMNKGSWDGIIAKYDFNGNLLWNRNFGGTGDDRFHGVNKDNDNIIVIGHSNSSNGDLTGVAKGGWDGVVVKYNSVGDIVWNKNFGGDSTDYFNGIDIISSKIIIVGESWSINMDLANKKKGSADCIIAKFNLNGDLIWNENFGGGPGNNIFFGVAEADSGYIAVGYSDSISGDLAGMNKGDLAGLKLRYDAIMVKYNYSGGIVWKKNYGGTGDDRFQGIVKTDGGYVAIGSSWSNNGDLQGMNKGGWDGIIVKFNETGDIIWNTNFGGSSSDYFLDIERTDDGYIVVGYSPSNNGDLAGNNKGGNDAVIVKFDNNGEVIWNRNFGGSGDDRFHGVTKTNDGYIAVGRSRSNNGDLVGMNNGDWDAIIVKYDFEGNLVWNKNYGGSNVDYFEGVTYLNNNYIAVGWSDSTNGDLAGMNKGSWDAVIISYDINGNINWNQNYGGTSEDRFYDINTLNNQLIVIGASHSTNGDLQGLSKGGWDGTFVKYNLAGDILNKKNFGGRTTDFFFNFSKVRDGFVAVGYTESVDLDFSDIGIGYRKAVTVGFRD